MGRRAAKPQVGVAVPREKCERDGVEGCVCPVGRPLPEKAPLPLGAKG